MENAPLNLAHLYERRAERHIKHKRFDDAIECLEKSLACIQDALQTVKVPKALEVVRVLEYEYKRQIQRVIVKKNYYENSKDANTANQTASGAGGGELRDSPFRTPDEMKMASIIVHEFGIGCNPPVGLVEFEEDETIMVHSFNEESRLRNDELFNLAPLELPSFNCDFFEHINNN